MKTKKKGDGEPSIWRRGLTHTIMWFPILAVIWIVVGVELVGYFFLRVVVMAWEFVRHRGLRGRLQRATTRMEWKEIAKRLDEEQGKEEWRKTKQSRAYDRELIERLRRELSKAREIGSVESVERLLTAATAHNVGGIENEELYSRTFVGTKECVEEFVEEVIRSTDWLSEEMNKKGKGRIGEEFCLSAARSWGRTALCLSGGAAMALPHIGVIKALIEARMLPNVISGTSCGAMIAAMICVRTEEEFLEVISKSKELERELVFLEDSIPEMARRWWKEGQLIDNRKWVTRLEWVAMGKTTFSEAFARTGRILNITVTNNKFGRSSHNAQLLNYVTTPNVMIFSAIMASAAMPILTGPVQLMEKNPKTGEIKAFGDLASTRWRDGSLSIDIPLAALSQLFGTKFTIVSQCNPHVVPFFFWPRGAPGAPSLHRQGYGWRGGFFFSWVESFLKLDMIKWMSLLRSMDLLPHFGGQDWSNLFLQQFFGSVTIIPRQTFLTFIRVATDASAAWWDWYRLEGERATWPRLSMIENHMKIEQALNRLFSRLAPGVDFIPPDTSHILLSSSSSSPPSIKKNLTFSLF